MPNVSLKNFRKWSPTLGSNAMIVRRTDVHLLNMIRPTQILTKITFLVKITMQLILTIELYSIDLGQAVWCNFNTDGRSQTYGQTYMCATRQRF